MTPEEHRRAPRIARHVLVRFRAPEGGQPRWDTVPSRDISALGARFLGAWPLQAGTSLELEVRLPSAQDAVPMKGEIVWKRPAEHGSLWEYGVFFTEVDAGAQQKLDETVGFFLHQRSARADE